MRIFCTQCGEANEVEPGQFSVCAGCGSTLQQGGATGSPPPAGQPSQPMYSPPPSANHGGAPYAGAPASVTQDTYRPLQGEPIRPGGSSLPSPYSSSGTQETNKLAIASLVFGIVCCFPPLTGTLALGLGATALKQIQERNEKGRELAIAGMVLGGLGVGMSILSLLLSLVAGQG